jgi:hypothetical protein
LRERSLAIKAKQSPLREAPKFNPSYPEETELRVRQRSSPQRALTLDYEAVSFTQVEVEFESLRTGSGYTSLRISTRGNSTLLGLQLLQLRLIPGDPFLVLGDGGFQTKSLPSSMFGVFTVLANSAPLCQVSGLLIGILDF